MAKKKVVTDDVLDGVKGGVNLNELNNKVLSVESKADALQEKVDIIAQNNQAIMAKVDSLANNMEARLSDKQMNKSKSIFQKLFGFKDNINI